MRKSHRTGIRKSHRTGIRVATYWHSEVRTPGRRVMTPLRLPLRRRDPGPPPHPVIAPPSTKAASHQHLTRWRSQVRRREKKRSRQRMTEKQEPGRPERMTRGGPGSRGIATEPQAAGCGRVLRVRVSSGWSRRCGRGRGHRPELRERPRGTASGCGTRLSGLGRLSCPGHAPLHGRSFPTRLSVMARSRCEQVWSLPNVSVPIAHRTLRNYCVTHR
jgi:hypothetical protein